MTTRSIISLVIAATLTASLPVFGLAGCTAEAKLGAPPPAPPPPPPPQAPVVADSDHDGIPDNVDKCPTQPETKNGFEDEDGCPDQVGISVGEHEIVYKEKILFAKGSHMIDPASDVLIGQLAAVINQHPELNFIEVAGHTDTDGSEKSNVDLGRKRAYQVILSLVKHGVSPSRLGAAGYGQYCPKVPGNSEAAMSQNRRVAFVILRKHGQNMTPNWDGCPMATSKGLTPQNIPSTAPTGP
jgi:OmpA-OmpF porin, OOP family